MATAKSIISVAILGDVKNLQKGLQKADTATAGFLKSAAKGFVALAVVDKVGDAVGSLIENGDRAGDAMGRLNTIIGEADTQKLAGIADDFSAIGVSAPDFLEIVAGFSEFATASGKMDAATITSMAGGVAEFAGALGRLKDVDPATLGDDIANFISGTRGAAAAAKELGVPFDAALTPAQRYAQLMERLPGLLDQVTGANAGLDDKQAKLIAQWETLGSEVGPVLEQHLSNVLGFILDEIDALPGAIEGWRMLGERIVGFGQTVLGPLGNVRDVLEDIVNLLSGAEGKSANVVGKSGVNIRRSDSRTSQDTRDSNSRNGKTNERVGGP